MSTDIRRAPRRALRIPVLALLAFAVLYVAVSTITSGISAGAV